MDGGHLCETRKVGNRAPGVGVVRLWASRHRTSVEAFRVRGLGGHSENVWKEGEQMLVGVGVRVGIGVGAARVGVGVWPRVGVLVC